MHQGLGLKRQRVARACQKCRTLKSKVCISPLHSPPSSQPLSDLVSCQCDGQRPVCSHCQGYGHACSWSENETSRSRSIDTSHVHSPAAVPTDVPRPSSSSEYSGQLRQAIQSYEKLISSLRLNLDDSSCAAADLTLSHIRHQLPEDVTSSMEPESKPVAAAVPGLSTRIGSSERASKRPRYLGEASDVHFFHMVKQVLGDKQLSDNATENDMQSYDQEEVLFESPNGNGAHLHLPSREIADKYIEIYFCTIHIAYPFICRPSFMTHYENFWKGDFEVGRRSPWLPLLCKFSRSTKYLVFLPAIDTIFAIGAYYFSFPHAENAESQTHLQYFEQAFSLGSSVMTDCNLENIHMLLAQCFFLLATGQSDRSAWVPLSAIFLLKCRAGAGTFSASPSVLGRALAYM